MANEPRTEPVIRRGEPFPNPGCVWKTKMKTCMENGKRVDGFNAFPSKILGLLNLKKHQHISNKDIVSLET